MDEDKLPVLYRAVMFVIFASFAFFHGLLLSLLDYEIGKKVL